MSEETPMGEETIVAVYDTAAHAAAAAADLLGTGVPASAVTQHARESVLSGGSVTSTASTQGQGFWASLFGGEPEGAHDTGVYDRSVAGGSTVVTVRAPAGHVAAILATLERHGPIDIDERGASHAKAQAATPTSRPVAPVAVAPAPVAPFAAVSAVRAGAEDRIQLAEESLVVGKRMVNRGTTRIRRYVVESPAEAQIRLHSEKVVVERHAVAPTVPATEADFSEKTLEMTETDEQAVVSKTARVVEEIALRREAADRTETVRDTVRREDVEIVQVPATAATAAPSGTARSTV